MLISNPLANPFFPPTLYVAGGVLAGTFVILLAVARFDFRRLSSGVLFKRWRVWAVIAPVYGLSILSGQLPTLALLSLLVYQGLREYSRITGLPRTYERVTICLGLLAGVLATLSMDLFRVIPPVLLAFGTLLPLVFYRRSSGIRHLAFAALGWGYIAWFLAHMMLVYNYVDGGPGILLPVGMATALSDVGAFTAGKLFGRHKLSLRLSPNKTWEGVGGNVAGAYLGIWLMGFALPAGFHLILLLGLPLVVSVGALWGDLLESAIKREFEVKDAGTWLAGFGGLLDRVDSLIIVVPLLFYSMQLLR
jgi:phosphatidate cytidylyltransferase